MATSDADSVAVGAVPAAEAGPSSSKGKGKAAASKAAAASSSTADAVAERFEDLHYLYGQAAAQKKTTFESNFNVFLCFSLVILVRGDGGPKKSR